VKREKGPDIDNLEPYKKRMKFTHNDKLEASNADETESSLCLYRGHWRLHHDKTGYTDIDDIPGLEENCSEKMFRLFHQSLKMFMTDPETLKKEEWERKKLLMEKVVL
jgi:hypothetical protein